MILASLLFLCATPALTHAERLYFSGPASAQPGTTYSLLALIADNHDPLVGYSLNVDVAPHAGSIGAVIPNITQSSFHVDRNVITAGGGSLDPNASVIIETIDGGLFINAQESNLIAVPVAVPNVSDALAQIVFNILPGTDGTFTISLGPFTALLDGNLELVPFRSESFELRVPEPATVGLFVIGAFLLSRKPRPHA